MAYLLRTLIAIMILAIALVIATAHGWVNTSLSHIELAIPCMMFIIFAQAFVMFYFIGVSRLINNVYGALHSKDNLGELFDEAPTDLSPYKEKVDRYVYQTTFAKRQTIPWTMMVLTLGSIGFLLGGAHHTGLVRKVIHSGVIYGFAAASIIAFAKQWKYLKKTHLLLREVKALFSISDDSM